MLVVGVVRHKVEGCQRFFQAAWDGVVDRSRDESCAHLAVCKRCLVAILQQIELPRRHGPKLIAAEPKIVASDGPPCGQS